MAIRMMPTMVECGQSYETVDGTCVVYVQREYKCMDCGSECVSQVPDMELSAFVYDTDVELLGIDEFRRQCHDAVDEERSKVSM